jgi:hypothetical protein
MEQIINFVNNRLALATKYPDTALTMCDQAFGALVFYYTCNPDQFKACEQFWDEVRPQFYELEIGG